MRAIRPCANLSLASCLTFLRAAASPTDASRDMRPKVSEAAKMQGGASTGAERPLGREHRSAVTTRQIGLAATCCNGLLGGSISCRVRVRLEQLQLRLRLAQRL